MDLFDRELDIADDRFETPRTQLSASKSYRSKQSMTPRSTNSDEYKTVSSHRSFHNDTADFHSANGSVNGDFPPSSRGSRPISYQQGQIGGRPPRSSESKYDSNNQNYMSDNISDMSYNDTDISDIFSYARHGRCDDIIRSLSRGVPVDCRDEIGNTMLIVACQNGNKRVIKTVLRNGANINIKNYKGNTPLHYCYHFGYGDTLGEYLISKGADTSLRNNAGRLCWEGI